MIYYTIQLISQHNHAIIDPDHFVHGHSQWEMTKYIVMPALIGWAHTQNDPWIDML